MKTIFEDTALEELTYWVRENRKNAVKIYKLIQDIQRNGMDKGEGKPEQLKYRSGWSRRIDQTNRLVYSIDENGFLHILSCKGHYED